MRLGTSILCHCMGIFCVAAFAQSAPEPVFEVASVKPATPQPIGQYKLTMRGGPGTDDPNQIVYSNVSLMSILRIAYDAQLYQISGPSWVSASGYDIAAKLPPGATKEQFNRMLINLLAERFRLRLHHEAREVSGYELATGKSGAKLVGSDGADPGVALTMKMAPTASSPVVLMTFKAQPLNALVKTLAEQLGRPVLDKTGLGGIYDFTLEFEATRLAATPALADPPNPSGPEILTAIQEQLGLKLVSRKVPLDMLIIDSADKIPTAN